MSEVVMAHKWMLRNKISDGEDWELPMIEHNCDGRSSQLHIPTCMDLMGV